MSQKLKPSQRVIWKCLRMRKNWMRKPELKISVLICLNSMPSFPAKEILLKSIEQNLTKPNLQKSKLTQSNLPNKPSKVETLNKVTEFDPWIRCAFGNVLPLFIADYSICAICCFVQPVVWELAALAISSCASSCDDPPANGGLYYGLKFAVMPSDGQQRGVKRQGLTSRWCYCPNIKANQLIRTRLSSLILMVQNLFWQNNRGWKSQLMGVHFWGQKHISNYSLILSLNKLFYESIKTLLWNMEQHSIQMYDASIWSAIVLWGLPLSCWCAHLLIPDLDLKVRIHKCAKPAYSACISG